MKMEDRIKFVGCRIENSEVDAASEQRCVVCPSPGIDMPYVFGLPALPIHSRLHQHP